MEVGENMKSELGLLGVVVFALGGAVLFEGLHELLNPSGGTPDISSVIGFIGFLFAGIGLFLIVQSGKPEMEHVARSV